jgi:hypothetical protein
LEELLVKAATVETGVDQFWRIIVDPIGGIACEGGNC